MAKRAPKSAEESLMYWCGTCKDITEHRTSHNPFKGQHGAKCTQCSTVNSVRLATGSMNAAAQRISTISRRMK